MQKYRISLAIVIGLSLGLIFVSVTLMNNAVSSLSTPVQKYPINNTKGNVSTHESDGKDRSYLEEINEALGNYDKVIAMNANPDNTDVSIDNDMTKFNESILDFDKVLAMDPNNIKALSNKGHSLLKLERFNEAIGLFDKALAIDPNNTDVLVDRKTALALRMRMESAS